MYRDDDFEDLYDIKLCVGVVGAKSVGKRTMIKLECEHASSSHPQAQKTIESGYNIEFKHKNYEIDGKMYHVEFWIGTDGERHFSKTAKLLSNLAATVIMFDVKDIASFDEARRWVREIEKNQPVGEVKDGKISLLQNGEYRQIRILLANRMERTHGDRRVTTEEAQEFAERNNLLYHEIDSLHEKTFRPVFATLMKVISKPASALFASEKPLAVANVASLAMGSIRIHKPMAHADKVKYVQTMQASCPHKSMLATTLDWL
ncbi:hypothetical protein HDU76_002558, partial [Blyttiomyces sp. JEL0837]